MKRETRDQAVERANANREEAGILSLALGYVANGDKPDHVEDWWIDGEDHYRAQLFGAKRADGGIVVITFRHPGQRPHTIAKYVDRWDGDCRTFAGLPEYLSERIACERIVSARNRIAGYNVRDDAQKIGA